MTNWTHGGKNNEFKFMALPSCMKEKSWAKQWTINPQNPWNLSTSQSSLNL